jgi:tetratricopeptide (TPR) repeat protein/predicted RNA-binding protein with RPS1 domain
MFLDELPNSESKILITSRWAIGSNERKYNLKPMTNNDAVELLTKLDTIMSGDAFTHYPKTDLSKYCKKMHNNPLYIKWFVYTVYSGKEPNKILENPGELLNYCVTNVYDTLNDPCKEVLKAMLCNPGEHRKAILTYLSELDNIQKELTFLFSRNMVLKINKPDKTLYEITDLAKEYLNNINIISDDERTYFLKRYRDLMYFKEKLVVKNKNNPYDYYSFQVKDENEIVIAKYLRDAVRRKNNYFEANEYIKKAKTLNNNYFEIFKTEGIINNARGEFELAEKSYYQAIQLAPENPVLRVYYAETLSKYTERNDEALNNLRIAEKISPDEFKVNLEIARVTMYLSDFEESKKYLDKLLQSKIEHDWDLRRLYNLIFSYYHRHAEFLKEKKSDMRNILEQLSLLTHSYEQYCTKYRIDSKMREILIRTTPIIMWVANTTSNDEYCSEDERDIVQELITWISKISDGDTDSSQMSLKNKLDNEKKKMIIPEIESEISFKIGDICKALITNINPEFGIFIKINNVPGLIHRSELIGLISGNYKKKYKIGENLDVEIININTNYNRFNARLKDSYKPLDKVTGRIIKSHIFGVIIEIDKHISGLLHKSEMSKSTRIKFNKRKLFPNTHITTYILDISDNSIKLSQTNINEICPKSD